MLPVGEKITADLNICCLRLDESGLPWCARKVDQDDIRVFMRAVEDYLFAVRCDVEGSHRGAVPQTGEPASFFSNQVQRPEKSCDRVSPWL
jgi:hypothetical protein